MEKELNLVFQHIEHNYIKCKCKCVSCVSLSGTKLSIIYIRTNRAQIYIFQFLSLTLSCLSMYVQSTSFCFWRNTTLFRQTMFAPLVFEWKRKTIVYLVASLLINNKNIFITLTVNKQMEQQQQQQHTFFLLSLNILFVWIIGREKYTILFSSVVLCLFSVLDYRQTGNS